MQQRIGITGSRKGTTPRQLFRFHIILLNISKQNIISELHHGDCVGFDEEAHKLVELNHKNINIHIHPPSYHKHRAFCETDDKFMHKEKPFLIRNKDIVNVTDILIAGPNSRKGKLRSGTWSTIRYALKKDKEIYIIYPDGAWEHKNALKE